MSGVRRKTKYRKTVESDVLNSFPEPGEGEIIVRVVGSRGGNVVEVETADGSKALCRLPNRYRKVVWIKRGTLLIVATCAEDYTTADGEQGKMKFIVEHVVFTDDQVKHLRKMGLLPEAFDTKDDSSDKNDIESLLPPLSKLTVTENHKAEDVGEDDDEAEEDDEEEEEDDDEFVSVNPNRRRHFTLSSSSSSDDDEEEEDD